MCEVVWVGIRGGKQFAWAAFGGRGGWAWILWGVRGGRVWATGWGGRAAGRGAPLGGCVWVVQCGWVCGGRVLVFRRSGEACVAGPGVARDGGRVCVPGPGEQREGRGMGGDCAVGCAVSVYVSARSDTLAWSVVGWAVWRRRLASSAAAARISQTSLRICRTSWSVVGRGYASSWLRPTRLRTLWMAWYPQVRECCSLQGGYAACPGLPRVVCGRWGWPKSRARSPWMASGAGSSWSGRAWPVRGGSPLSLT